MGHYNRVARKLAEEPEAYVAVSEVDFADGDLLWGCWISGFERAMRLRTGAWEQIAIGDDQEAAESISMVIGAEQCIANSMVDCEIQIYRTARD